MGAERRDRVGNLLRLLTWAEATVGLVATVIFECFPRQLIGIFGAAEESVHYTNFAIRCIRIFLAMTTLSCINKGAFIFLQAMGKGGGIHRAVHAARDRVRRGASAAAAAVLGAGWHHLLHAVFGYHHGRRGAVCDYLAVQAFQGSRRAKRLKYQRNTIKYSDSD